MLSGLKVLWDILDISRTSLLAARQDRIQVLPNHCIYQSFRSNSESLKRSRTVRGTRRMRIEKQSRETRRPSIKILWVEEVNKTHWNQPDLWFILWVLALQWCWLAAHPEETNTWNFEVWSFPGPRIWDTVLNWRYCAGMWRHKPQSGCDHTGAAWSSWDIH